MNTDSGDRYELEADHFSAGLLMPGYLFDKALDKIQSGLHAIETLSKICETSLTATAIRYAQRTSDPVAIVVSEKQTIKFCFMSDELRGIKGLSWISKGKPLPRNSVTYRFNQSKYNILGGCRSEGVATLLDWFDSTLQYDLYEEVVGLGNYRKTLTILSMSEIPDQEEIDEENDLVGSWVPRFKR